MNEMSEMMLVRLDLLEQIMRERQIDAIPAALLVLAEEVEGLAVSLSEAEIVGPLTKIKDQLEEIANNTGRIG